MPIFLIEYNDTGKIKYGLHGRISLLSIACSALDTLVHGQGSSPELRMRILLIKGCGPLDENPTATIIITLKGPSCL
ncbi:hypothetical protein COP2_011797 [Malus domestica]